MSAAFRTKAEQRVQWLEGIGRPLTDAESDDLRRALHAVYCRDRRLIQHEKEERELLAKVEAEAKQKEWYPDEVRG